MKMETLVLVTILAALGVGFGAGWGLKPDKAAKVLQEQAVAIEKINTSQAALLEAMSEGQAKILEQASRPVVIDAELRATLAEVPIQCLREAGGDPQSVACQWATCLQFGQSSAQRPECRKIEDLMVQVLKTQAGASESGN
jgi:hypothetical protein